MMEVEGRLDRLEADLVSCGKDKDIRLNAMHTDMNNIHSDMGALQATVSSLTEEVRNAVHSLQQIASNTANMGEMVMMYERWKGFAWVIKSVGFWGAIIIAFIVGAAAAAIKLG